MSTLVVDAESLVARKVSVSDDSLVVDLADGRTLSAPLVWFPRLLHATPQERGNWRLIGRGEGVHWPDLDEDISMVGLIAGRPSAETPDSLKRWLKKRAKQGSR